MEAEVGAVFYGATELLADGEERLDAVSRRQAAVLEGGVEGDGRVESEEKWYRPTDLLADGEEHSGALSRRQAAIFGALQITGGLFSIALGLLSAITMEMTSSLVTLFRVPQTSGLLVTFAGVLSTQMFKRSPLLPVCVMVNLSCGIVGFAAGVLICLDLRRDSSHGLSLVEATATGMAVLELCVLGLEVLLSAGLCLSLGKKMASAASANLPRPPP